MKVIPPIDLNNGTFTRASTATYFDSSNQLKIAEINEPRFTHYINSQLIPRLLIEPERTNYLLNSDINATWLSTQSIAVTNKTRTLSFFSSGAGVVTLSGAYSAVIPAVGQRTEFTYTPNVGTLTFTVSGDVYYAQDEIGDYSTSFIPTAGIPVTRSADSTNKKGISSVLSTESISKWDRGSTYAVDTKVYSTNINGLLTCYKAITSSYNVFPSTESSNYWKYIGQVYQKWDGNTTYGIGEYVQSANNIVYESLITSNKNNPVLDSSVWNEITDTNANAPFNYLRGSVLTAPESVMIGLIPGERVDSLALFGLDADSVEINVHNKNDLVYSSTASLATRNIGSWYEFFFTKIKTKPSLSIFDIPPFENNIITVKLKRTNGTVALNNIVTGQSVYIGDVAVNAINDAVNYSTVNRDFTGGISLLVQRRNINKLVQSIYCNKQRLSVVKALRDSINATPVVWAGLTDENADSDFAETILLLGFYKKFSFGLNYLEHFLISLEVEEV